jgi:hypothetical protein
MKHIQLDIDFGQFQSDLRKTILNAGMRNLPSLINDLIIEQFEGQLKTLVASGQILRFKINYKNESGSPDSHIPPRKWPVPLATIQLPWFLKDLPKQTLIDLGWFEFTIISKLDADIIEFEGPHNLDCQQPLDVKCALLKTTRKYIVRMGWMGMLGMLTDVLIPVGDLLIPTCTCSSDSLAPYTDGVWDWTIRFICRICGKSYYCECFRKALEKHYLNALEKQGGFSENGWPRKFIKAYEKSLLRDNICHLCRDIPSDLFYCHPMYGSKVKVHYGPYIKRIAIEKNIVEDEAENEIRDLLGIPHIGEGWISELDLLNIVRSLFPNKEALHQSSPEWLGRQRFDIFLPELRVAIEYQGLQHYAPVTLFGGENGFLKTKERDNLKAKLCYENGIKLVLFSYNETITRELVESRINNALQDK